MTAYFCVLYMLHSNPIKPLKIHKKKRDPVLVLCSDEVDVISMYISYQNKNVCSAEVPY